MKWSFSRFFISRASAKSAVTEDLVTKTDLGAGVEIATEAEMGMVEAEAADPLLLGMTTINPPGDGGRTRAGHRAGATAAEIDLELLEMSKGHQ